MRQGEPHVARRHAPSSVPLRSLPQGRDRRCVLYADDDGVFGELLGAVGVDLQHLDDAVVHEQHAASAVGMPSTLMSAWATLRPVMLTLRPSFEGALRVGPTLAVKLPALVTLLGARTAIAMKAVAPFAST